MPRETVRITWNEMEIRKKFSPEASILFSTESEIHRLTVKAWTVWRPVLRLKLKIPVFGWQDEKDHRVFINIIPCVVVTSLETDAFMAIVACIDELMVRATSARGRKKVFKEQLLFWDEKKKRPSLCISKFSANELKNWDWTLRRDTPEILGDASGTKLNSGKKEAIWRN